VTKLRLSDPALIDGYVSEITSIGESVNDPQLFNRIQKACLNKQAFLFVSRDGFVVLKPMAGKRLLIWVACSFLHTNRLSYLYEIERFARDIDARILVFWSNRRGFNRLSLGFSSVESEWMGRPITVWSKHL